MVEHPAGSGFRTGIVPKNRSLRTFLGKGNLMTSVFWIKVSIFALAGTILSLVDLKIFRLPHALTLPLAGTGFLFSFLPGNGITPIRSGAGFLAGVFLLGLLSWFRHGSFGFGDAVFSGAIGTYAGVAGLGIALFAGGGLAVIFGLGKDRGPMAFGPYLAFGGVCSLIVLSFVPNGFGKILF